jgi:Fe-S-cluster formation regulator IscX/YfhJ
MPIVEAEVKEEPLTPYGRALARDEFLQEFERQFSNWTDIARCCVEAERDKDYELLGFKSFHSWIMVRAPRSRSYLYLVMGRYRELIVDIPEEELAKIPLGSAGILRQLSSAARRKSKIRQSARKSPAEFRKDIREELPEQHLEILDSRTYKFTASQARVIDTAMAKFREDDPKISDEDIIESWAAEAL